MGLDHTLSYNQISISSSDHNDPKFANTLEALHKIHLYFKFNTFDVVRYTKQTDDKLGEHEFTIRLMSRQYNTPEDLHELNNELEIRMQVQEMKQSGLSIPKFKTTNLPFNSYYILNIKNNDEFCLQWCLIAYLHPAKDHPN